MFLRGKGSGSLGGVNVFLLKPHLCANVPGKRGAIFVDHKRKSFLSF